MSGTAGNESPVITHVKSVVPHQRQYSVEEIFFDILLIYSPLSGVRAHKNSEQLVSERLKEHIKFLTVTLSDCVKPVS